MEKKKQLNYISSLQGICSTTATGELYPVSPFTTFLGTCQDNCLAPPSLTSSPSTVKVEVVSVYVMKV